MDLNLSMGQKQVLSARIQLSVKILQMNAQELEQHIYESALENPLIELEKTEAPEDTAAERLKKLEWLESMDESSNYRYSYNYDAEETATPIYEDTAVENLSAVLLSQIPGFHLEAQLETLVRYLIDNLDENGYLTLSREEILSAVNTDEKALNTALETLWRMDPPGVGALDLRECLMLQARRQDNPSATLLEIIDKHLDLLAKNQPGKIAKAMGVSLEEVKEAKSRLLTLNPKPGNGYSSYNSTPYIRPDLFIVHFENSFQIILNDYNQPRITINSQYKQLAGKGDAEVDGYIGEKLRAAEWLVSCIESRKNTLLRCAEKILLWQMRFFEHGPGYKAPMTLQDIASQLDIHPSTVSRAVAGKYLQCQWGVFGLGDFFSRTINHENQEQSQDMLSAAIKRIINGENKSKPLSDQQISDCLGESGIAVARRTVAKYREQLNIPTASRRKEY